MDTESRFSQLSDLERDVVTLLVREHTYRDTAERLGMTMEDLEGLVIDVFERLGVRTRTELSMRFGDGSGGPTGDREPRTPSPPSDSGSVDAPTEQ